MNEQIKAGADIHAGNGEYRIGTKEEYDKFAKARNRSLAQERIRELALQAGGSHYPEVGGETLQLFAELLINECLYAIDRTDKTHAYTTFDLSMIETTIEKTKRSVQKHLGIET